MELKPCPFCGRKPSKVREYYAVGTKNIYYAVECKAPNTKCFVKPKTTFFKTQEEAIEAWNRRAT
jgi:Lar family restriction alleviation protein